ncbi:MAG: hypothetical protein ACPLKX_03885 [Dictyoglomaceae bacterium]
MENILYKYLGWLKEDNQYRDIFVRTKIRLMRNVADFPFPNQAGSVKRRTFLNKVEWLLRNDGFLENFNFIHFDKTSPQFKQSFWEKGILDKEPVGEGKGILINKMGDLSILINEDSHFQFQKILSGFEFENILSQLYELEDKMSEYFDFAFDPKMGYLTSLLNNLGLGLKVTFWVHLPGLYQKGELSNIIRSLKSSKVYVKGVYEEEDYSVGNLYEISINEGLSSEDQLFSRITKIVEKIVKKEEEARKFLMEEKRIYIEDIVGKSLGLIKHSKLLSFKGSLELLFNIRLGSSLNIVSIPLRLLDIISIFIHPVHIQLRYKKEINSQEKDILRANLLRDVFKSYKIE